MLRVAIIGVGGYGATLLAGLRSAAGAGRCRIVAVADASAAAIARAADDLRDAGAATFADGGEMLEALRGRCDVVYVATSIASHAALTAAAARCGFHVHLEKPPAATVQEVDEMLEALARAGRMCLVGFQNLHAAEMLRLRQALAGGLLGKVLRVSCAANWPRPRKYYRRNEWAGRLRAGGAWVLDGAASNALAHQIAHCLALACPRAEGLAEPVAVRAELYAAGDMQCHNIAAIEVRTADGVDIHLLLSHAGRARFEPLIEVVAERGRAYLQPGSHAVVYAPDGTEPWYSPARPAREAMIANMLDAVEAGRPEMLRCPLSQARKCVLVVDGAHESTGRIGRLGEGAFRREPAGSDAERVEVPRLCGMLLDAAERHCLLSDLPDGPAWAVRTEPFDLAGYRRFPQRFRCE